jgi:hypothetical protein
MNFNKLKMRKFNKLLIGLVIFSTFLLTLHPTYAQGPIERIPIISECIDQFGDPIQRILCVVRAVFYILGFVALAVGAFSIFQAAWTFMSAGEKSEEVGKARSKIVFAIVGIAVALLSFAIAWLIGMLLGFQAPQS